MLGNFMHFSGVVEVMTAEPKEPSVFSSLDLDLPIGSELLQMLNLHGFRGKHMLLLSLKRNDFICLHLFAGKCRKSCWIKIGDVAEY
jgi:hypothetical protein